MFKTINTIEDIKPFVSHKEHIRFSTDHQSNITIACYLIQDNETFDSIESLECRGIAFDKDGKVVSRPLHKFFNAGERNVSIESIINRNDIAGVFDKIDGSMISTLFIDDQLLWRSKKSLNSDIVQLVKNFVYNGHNNHIHDFAYRVASQGYTAIFEFVHPDNRIVVGFSEPAMHLLHVRHNITGEYVMIDPNHFIHDLIRHYNIPVVKRYAMSMQEAVESLTNMENQEGYVIQFNNGDMVKLKCNWYLRLHRVISFLRERDIARASLRGELDDIKSCLTQMNVDLEEVNKIEARVAHIISSSLKEIENICNSDKNLDRKSFAIKHSKNPLFGMLMSYYLGRIDQIEQSLCDWYEKNKLNDEFSLRYLRNAPPEEN